MSEFPAADDPDEGCLVGDVDAGFGKVLGASRCWSRYDTDIVDVELIVCAVVDDVGLLPVVEIAACVVVELDWLVCCERKLAAATRNGD